IGGLIFDDTTPSHNWTLNTGTSGSLTLAVPGGIPVVTVGSQTTTINAAIAGNQGLVKSGAGTLVLRGANTFTGMTVIDAGTLSLLEGAGTNTTTYSGAGTLGIGIRTTGLHDWNPNGTVGSDFIGLIDVQTGSNQLRLLLGGGTQFSNNLGDLNVGSGSTVAINAATNLQFDALSGSGTITNSAGSASPATFRFGANNGTGTFAGNITSASSVNGVINLVKQGSGTQAFTGNITNATGTLTISAGTLQFSAGNQTIGSTTSGAGALLKDGTGTLTIVGASSVSGGTTISGGTLRYQNSGTSSGAVSLNGGTLNMHSTVASGYRVHGGAVTANAASSITVTTSVAPATANSSNLFLDGGLKGSAPVTITGAPHLGVALRNANSNYSGTLTVQGTASEVSAAGGGLSMDQTTAMSSADIIVNGTLELGGGAATGLGWANSTTTGGTVSMDALGGTGVVVANFAAARTRTLSVGNNNGSDTFSGVIGAGSFSTLSFIKNGTGTQTLSGANTYTGSTTVAGGTLLVNGSLGNSATTVAAPATLGGIGSIAGAVTNNGTLSPGDGAVGSLTINNTLTLAHGAAMDWEITNWTGTSGTGWDTLTATSLNLTATSANPVVIRLTELDLANFAESSQNFTLIQTTGGITGFSADKFVVDTTGISLPLGTWAVEQSGNNLVLAYTRINNAPVFTADPILANAIEDSAFSGSILASDSDLQESLVYSKLAGPAWLSVAANGSLSGTPSNNDVGINHFTVQVTDSFGAQDTATLSVTVANVNDAPVFVLNPIAGAAATEDVAYSGSLATDATDVDAGDT
ncbi:MAG TPA: autotransporter-associated beta strand repeat-containing protein, partial [Luteolibacter sp.]